MNRLAYVLLALATACGGRPAFAAQDDAFVEPGVRFQAIGSADVNLGGEAPASVRPSLDIEVDGPLAIGSTTPLRVGAELRIFGQPGETIDLGSVETFRAFQLALSASRRVGRVKVGEQEVWTSAVALWGFSTVLGDLPLPASRYPRRYGVGLLLEERQSGARLEIVFGRDEAAGPRGWGQTLVRGRVPLSITRGAVVLGGEAVLSVGPPKQDIAQRDYARLTVGISVPDLVGLVRK